MIEATSMPDIGRFRRLIALHYETLRRFLRRRGLPPHRVDDVTQTSFLVTFEAIPRIASGAERAFLYATAVRVSHDLGRRVHREVATADFDLDSSPNPAPDDLTHQKRTRELLHEVLGGIERESRAVFIRFEVEGLTIREIADSLSIPAEAATCRLRRARKQFRALVKGIELEQGAPC